MTPEQQKQWGEVRNDYINRQMAVFQKHFGKKSLVCEDCGGPMWQMCEKNLRDMVSMTADAVMRSFVNKSQKP